jgi:hypothetical protein
MTLSTNPYHVSGPLAPTDLLINRERIFAWIEASLGDGERLLALYGLPKMGKSSVLHHLPGRLAGSYIPVLSWIPSMTGWELDAWSAELEAEIAAALQSAGRQVPDDWTLDMLPASLGDDTLLILVDGLSLYAETPDVWDNLLGWLRHVTSEYDVRTVLSIQGSRGQVETISPALAQIPGMTLSCLREDQVRDLLVRIAGDKLVYDYDAIRQIHYWTAGHPYLVQCFGQTLFAAYSERGRVGVHDVERVVPDVQTQAGNLFGHLWNTLSAPAQMALAVLGEHRGRHDLFTGEDVTNFLKWARIAMPPEDTVIALEGLTAKGILEPYGADSFHVPIHLFSRWLAQEKPAEVVVREIKRYKQRSSRQKARPSEPPLRWTSVLSWGLTLVIIFLIIWIWQSREPPEIEELSTLTPMAIEIKATPRVTPTPIIRKSIVYTYQETKEDPIHLFRMSDDGNEQEALTSGPQNDTNPAWSPDGERVVFVSDRTGNKDLWVMDIAGQELGQITDHPGDEDMPAWSPGGNALAFAAYREGNWDIYISRADGDRPRRLTSHPTADVAPAWSPDGRWLAFASYRDDNWEIYVISRDGSELMRLTENDATDFRPAWSPQGNLIAFESYRDGDMEIYVVGVEGEETRNLTNAPAANDHGPAWDASGEKLWFYSNQEAGWDIFSLNLDGSGLANMTKSEALEQDPAVQP